MAPAPPLPGPSVVSTGQGVGRGGGLGRGRGPGARKTLAMRVMEGRRRAREGPAQRGRGGEGRGGDSVIGAPPPSRPGLGMEGPGDQSSFQTFPVQVRGGGWGRPTPAGSPICPSCPRAWISPKAGPDQPEIHYVQQDRGPGGLCRPCKEQALFPSRKKSHNLLRDPSQGYDLPTGLGVTMKHFLLVGRPPVTRS